jgi:hypothetical protein
MRPVPETIDPEYWMRSVLSSRDACRGGVIKRQIRDVERIVGREAFLAEMDRRGFQTLRERPPFHRVLQRTADPARQGGGLARARATDARARPRPSLALQHASH